MSAMTWQVQDLVLAVLEMDKEQLDIVSKALRLRHKHLHDAQVLETQMKLYVGDSVVLRNLKTKWMNGETGRVSELLPDHVKVDLNSRHYNQTGGGYVDHLTVPFACVEKR